MYMRIAAFFEKFGAVLLFLFCFVFFESVTQE